MCILRLPPSILPTPPLLSHSFTSHRKERVGEVAPGQTEENEPDLLGLGQSIPMLFLTISISNLTAVLEGHSLVSATHLPLPPSPHTPGATTVQNAQRKREPIKRKVVMMGVKVGTTVLPLPLPHTPESHPANTARYVHACICLCSCVHYFVIHVQHMYVTCLPTYVVLAMCRCNCMHTIHPV